MGYYIIEVVVLLAIVFGILYLIKFKNKNIDIVQSYKILNYFKDNNAVNFESGIKVRDIPKEILKSNDLMLLLSKKQLCFKKGKYYLNINE